MTQLFLKHSLNLTFISYDLEIFIWPLLLFDLESFIWPIFLVDLESFIWPIFEFDFEIWSIQSWPSLSTCFYFFYEKSKILDVSDGSGPDLVTAENSCWRKDRKALDRHVVFTVKQKGITHTCQVHTRSKYKDVTFHPITHKSNCYLSQDGMTRDITIHAREKRHCISHSVPKNQDYQQNSQNCTCCSEWHI